MFSLFLALAEGNLFRAAVICPIKISLKPQSSQERKIKSLNEEEGEKKKKTAKRRRKEKEEALNGTFF